MAFPISCFKFQDFNSTLELAKYLHTVNQNDALYALYFWWRNYYHMQVSSVAMNKEHILLQTRQISLLDQIHTFLTLLWTGSNFTYRVFFIEGQIRIS